jgi:hypothetical protein
MALTPSGKQLYGEHFAFSRFYLQRLHSSFDLIAGEHDFHHCILCIAGMLLARGVLDVSVRLCVAS